MLESKTQEREDRSWKRTEELASLVTYLLGRSFEKDSSGDYIFGFAWPEMIGRGTSVCYYTPRRAGQKKRIEFGTVYCEGCLSPRDDSFSAYVFRFKSGSGFSKDNGIELKRLKYAVRWAPVEMGNRSLTEKFYSGPIPVPVIISSKTPSVLIPRPGNTLSAEVRSRERFVYGSIVLPSGKVLSLDKSFGDDDDALAEERHVKLDRTRRARSNGRRATFK